MKHNNIYIILFTILLLLSCEKERPDPTGISTKITISLGDSSWFCSDIATLYGTLGTTYGRTVQDYGHCWDTLEYPDLSNNKTAFGASDKGVRFSSFLENLIPDMSYYVRAYFKINDLTVYGEEKVFRTQKNGFPCIITAAISDIKSKSAKCGGLISNDGSFPVTARGVCWNTSGNPTITDNKTTDGSGIGSFTSSLTDLEVRTTYYIRAYATNSAGTGYGNEMCFITFEGVTDYDGYIYQTVQIGSQIWMAENLKAIHYADGTAIPLAESSSDWDNLGSRDKAYCWYDNSTSNRDTYGGLYTWAAAMNGTSSSSSNPSGVQGVCPDGWHLPSDAEWKELEIFLGMSQSEANEGSKLAGNSGLWNSGDLKNNTSFGSSGFIALPGGGRLGDGSFYYLGYGAYFWSATKYNALDAWSRTLFYYDSDVYWSINYKGGGFSVRCLKD